MMTKPALILASLLLACNSVMAAEHTVEMKNTGADGMMVFEPAVVKAAPGDTIRFVPTDPAHNSESVPGLIPDGAQGWKGALNEEVSVTLEQEGVYVYKCLPHTALGMVGIVVVGAPVNLEEVQNNAAAFKAGIAANKERLDKYLGMVE